MTENDSQQKRSTERNPYTPWFVVIAFVAPVIAAYSLYFLDIKPPSYNNKGELLSPIIDVESLAFTNDKNEKMTRDEVTEHKWHMMYFSGADCNEACDKVLHKIRQVNIATGKNAYRLRRLIVHLEKAGPEFQSLINEKYPDVIRVNGDSKTIKAAFEKTNINLHANEIYLMDPLGNIMMRFTQEQPPKDILHDLNKLFKVSQIG